MTALGPMRRLCLLAIVILTGMQARAALAQYTPPGAMPPPPPVLNNCACAEAQPFRLGLEYARVFSESGDLATQGNDAQALGLDFTFTPARSVVQHLGIAHQWQDRPAAAGMPAVSTRGFRIDLLSVGFPMRLPLPQVMLELQPILRVMRGEILWESVGDQPSTARFRFESGFGVRGVAVFKRGFIAIEPLSVDFRWATASTDDGKSGFARLWSWAMWVGREF